MINQTWIYRKHMWIAKKAAIGLFINYATISHEGKTLREILGLKSGGAR